MTIKLSGKEISGIEYANLCACLNLRKTSRAVTNLYNERLKEVGILSTQLPLLVALDQAGPIPLTRLSAILEMDRTTLSRNWLPLFRKGLTREADSEDQRSRVLVITEEGRRVMNSALSKWVEIHSELINKIGEGNFSLLLEQLKTVRNIVAQE